MTGAEDFAKRFAAAFGRQDAAELAQLLAEDADVLTLTGAVVETAAEAEAAFAGEFAGIFAVARLVSGKHRLRVLGPGGAVVTQRFVVSGARDDQGAEMPRFGAVLTAVLTARSTGWQAVSLTFSATGQ
jgi:ketosteroid isomerase-like protein